VNELDAPTAYAAQNPYPLAKKRADINIWLLRVPADGLGAADYE
jgi:hypothetical protein